MFELTVPDLYQLFEALFFDPEVTIMKRKFSFKSCFKFNEEFMKIKNNSWKKYKSMLVRIK